MSQNLGSLSPLVTQYHTSSTPSAPLNVRRNLWMPPRRYRTQMLLTINLRVPKTTVLVREESAAAEPGTEPGTSWPGGNEVVTKPNIWAKWNVMRKLEGVKYTPTSTPTRPVDNVVIATKGLQDRNINILAGTTVENKGKLILSIHCK